MRQLPRDARAVRRLDKIESSIRCRVQRLSCPGGTCREVRHQGHQRLLALAGLHDGPVSGPHSCDPAEQAHCRGGLPEMPRPDDRGNPDGTSDRRRRSRACAATTRSDICDDGTRRRAYGPRCRPKEHRRDHPDRRYVRNRTCAQAQPDAAGPHDHPCRRIRDRRHGTAREHLPAQAGGARAVLPRRGTHRRDHRPGHLGQELPVPVRQLQAHRRPAADPVRRK